MRKGGWRKIYLRGPLLLDFGQSKKSEIKEIGPFKIHKKKRGNYIRNSNSQGSNQVSMVIKMEHQLIFKAMLQLRPDSEVWDVKQHP